MTTPSVRFDSPSATLVVNGKAVDKLQTKYNEAVAKLETAQWKLAHPPKDKPDARPMHKEAAKCFCCGGHKARALARLPRLPSLRD